VELAFHHGEKDLFDVDKYVKFSTGPGHLFE